MEEIFELVKQAVDRASQLFHQGKTLLAEEMYRQVLRVDSSNADARNMLPLVVARNDRPEEAITLAQETINHDPTNFQLYNNLGLILGSSNKHSEAITAFLKAIELEPTSFIYSNLALEYKKVGNHKMARKTFEWGIRLCRCEHVHFNYGAYLDEIGKQNEAIKYYLSAIKINPDMAVSHYNLATDYLLLGDFENGYREYEWRWKAYPNFNRTREKFLKPDWNGEDGRVLLYCEQGLGDLIQFFRYLRFIKEPILECPPELQSLFKVKTVWGELPEYDYRCSLLSLPKMFGNDFCGPYLKADGICSNEWKKYDGFKIGISWAGNPRHPNDQRRSCWLNDFACLDISGVKLFSLQKDLRKRYWASVGEVDLTSGASFPLVDLSEHLNSFMDLANFIQAMDLVITVDTSVAHMAGALGKKVWMLTPLPCDWRWMLAGDKTGWYPSMTLYRNEGSWKDVFKRILCDLRKLL